MSSVTPVPSPSSALEPRLAHWIENRGRSVLRNMVSVVARPGILSLAGGLPAAELFPAAEYGAAVSVVSEDPRALQYGVAFAPLKDKIVELMARRGVTCRPEQVLVTSGAQQGIDICARLLVDPGGCVAMEELTYTGIQQAVAPMRPRVLSVPSDLEEGLDPDVLEKRLEAGELPEFLYLIPDAHNPLGVSLSTQRRRKLLELAHAYGFYLVEDDPYGLLWLDRPFEPPLRALDDERVIYLGSFSKIVAPALRLGWMVLPERLIEKATIVKDGLDLETSGLTQRATNRLLEELSIDTHLERLRSTYRSRRDALLGALDSSMPPGVRFSRPRGGMFVWLDLSTSDLRESDTERLLHRVMKEQKVAFIPGVAFESAPGRGRTGMRLSFSTLNPEQIEGAVNGIVACLERS